MSMTKQVAQLRIANEIRAAEQALDEALLRQSSLLSAMITARKETGSGPIMGHEAMLRLINSQQSVLSAGGDLARVHGNLLKIQQDVLGYEDCPDEDGPVKNVRLAGMASS